MRALVKVAAGIFKIVLVWRGSLLHCFFSLGMEKVVQGIAREIPMESCSAAAQYSCSSILMQALDDPSICAPCTPLQE